MNRLTTSEEYPHGAEGTSADKLTGDWCRGKFEATACVEKLSRYEDTGLEPEEVSELITSLKSMLAIVLTGAGAEEWRFYRKDK
ncbi:hypothetical protein [Lacrimispora amygdalina]|uniref:hypothetical protein n=1 Tax=Lacrimispora amygdalina TaxID=253257 RepID=UPI000BE49137|nr:hypothetical protein [Lacrimispora amygdalina]